MMEVCTSQGDAEQNQRQVTAFKWFINLAKQGWRSSITDGKWSRVLWHRGRYCHVCSCRQWEAPSPHLPSALKQNKTKLKQTKQTKFSSVHTRECLASAAEQHSCWVSLSIKWHARPLPRKILVPNTNHAPWLPSSVYSSRTTIHPCSHLKDIKIIMRKSLTYCAGKSWDVLQRQCLPFPERDPYVSLCPGPHLNEETSLQSLHGESLECSNLGGRLSRYKLLEKWKINWWK